MPFDSDLISMQLEDIVVSSYKGLDHLQLRAFEPTGPTTMRPQMRLSGELQLLSYLEKPPYGYGKLVNPRWTAPSLPRRWLHRCRSEHASKCEPPEAAHHLSRVRPTWLIDVWRKCLTKPSANDEYVALSYVWGETPAFMALRSNVNQLREPLFLSDGKEGAKLPRTIREAMLLVDSLGLRYLWVDSLCIIQDDDVNKNTEISNMAAIYSNATMTIVASDGKNSENGLRGLPGISSPRSAKQTVHTLQGGIHVLQSKGNGIDVSGKKTVWNTRGWTFQEYMFSRRRLFFENGWIRWSCNNVLWQETSALHGPIFHEQLQNDPRIGLFQMVPKLGGLSQIISSYNQRDLTFSEDALHGISGCLTAMSKSLPDGFISGLPIAFFYAALLWNPYTGHVRRTAKISERAHCLPSWSWAGWHGDIDTRFWALGFVKNSPSRERLRQLDRVKPLVVWSWHITINGPRTPIRNSWLDFEQKYHNATNNTTCPRNWTRHKFVPDDSLESWKIMAWPDPSVQPSCFYKHASEPMSEFWYPVPLLADDSDLKAQIQAPYISCTTKRAFLRAGHIFTPKFWKQIPVMAIEDDRSEWVGALRLQKGVRRDDGGVQVIQPPRGQTMELVEVALGFVRSDADELESYMQVLEEWYHEQRPRTHPLYEYYFVLWIERKDGVAYRKALGRVEKGLWEAQKRDEIELTLG